MSVVAQPVLTQAADATPAAPMPSPRAAANDAIVWCDGQLQSMQAPVAGITTHALHYGSGVFEGIRAYATAKGAAVFRLHDHLQRMQRGADLLGLAFDIPTAHAAVITTLRANHHRDAYIRPLVWSGEGSFGLDVAGHAQHMMVATTPAIVHLAGADIRVALSGWRRNPAAALPPLKLCGGYVNSILAKRESKQRGFDEALFVDAEGFVVECTGANVFLVKAGKVTAVEHRDALPGITRDTLIALSGAQARPVHYDELLQADEVFACGTAAEVAPIAAIETRTFGDNPVGRELAHLYAHVVRGQEASTPAAWLTEF